MFRRRTCIRWFFTHIRINEIHGSRRKIPIKNLVRQRYAEGFNSGVKGLNFNRNISDEIKR
jgi:hypothetical protein